MECFFYIKGIGPASIYGFLFLYSYDPKTPISDTRHNALNLNVRVQRVPAGSTNAM